MRILLRARVGLLSSRHGQTIQTYSSPFRPLPIVDDFAGTCKCYSIFASKIIPNFQLNQIHRRNIGINSGKTKQVQNVVKRTDPDGYCIYNGKSTSTIKRLRLYSFAMGIYGLYTQPFLWNMSQLFAETGLAIQDSFFIPGAIGAVLPIFLHSRIKTYVADIWYNKETDEYTCSTISFFLLKNKIKFKIEDIQHTENRTGGTIIKIGPKNIPLLFEESSFIESEHYARILGYDTRTEETITDGESIYSSPHTRSITRSKIFSYGILVFGLMAQIVFWEKWGVWGCSIAGTFTFVMPILTHFRVKNIVLDIRHNKETDEYTCTTNSIFSLGNKIKFKVEDIHNLEAQTIFTSLKVGPNNVPLFIEKDNFTDPTHYARLMGHDKPFDFGTIVDLLDDVNRKSLEPGTETHQKSNGSSSTDSESKKKEQRV